VRARESESARERERERARGREQRVFFLKNEHLGTNSTHDHTIRNTPPYTHTSRNPELCETTDALAGGGGEGESGSIDLGGNIACRMSRSF
jgi:hypothetical protein